MPYYKINNQILDKQVIELAPRYYGQVYYLIEKSLLELGFKVNSMGFKYWVIAIIGYRRNKYHYNDTIESIYEDIAKKMGTTRSRVERSMRTARADATKNIQEYFNYYKPITNKTVLSLLTSQFYLFSNDKHIPHID